MNSSSIITKGKLTHPNKQNMSVNLVHLQILSIFQTDQALQILHIRIEVFILTPVSMYTTKMRRSVKNIMWKLT